MTEHLTDVKEVREAALEHRLLSDEQEARAEEIAHKLRFAWAQRKGGRLIVDLRDRVAELERDAQRWEFFRKHHLSDYQGKRVHQWLIDNLVRADGLDGAIDELIQVCTTETTGEGAK